MYLLRYPTQVVHILIFFVEGWANPRWKTSFGGLASGRHGTLPTFCGKVWDDGNDLSINRPVQESVSRYFFRKKVSKTFVAILFSASLYCNPCYSVADQRPSGGQYEKLPTVFSWVSVSRFLNKSVNLSITILQCFASKFFSPCFLGRRVWQGQNESRCQKSERTECRG